MKKVLLLGSGAREQAMASVLKSSAEEVELFVFASSVNPGLRELAKEYRVGQLRNNTAIASFASQAGVDFCLVGPEAPLAEGIVDVLEQIGILSVGPTKKLAQIETSKAFTRELLAEYKIPGSPEFMVFDSLKGTEDWLRHLEESFVIKPDGLTGGKGVKVAGDHFKNMNEGLSFIKEILDSGAKVVIEEKLVGQEFSLMSFCDGDHLIHLPAVQDHKRALAGDQGSNTGGMGSYSAADFSLPFLEEDDLVAAKKINEAVALALKKKIGRGYKGVLYGGFMATKTGVKLIEYNARFGDPEAMNVLALFSEKTFPPSGKADFLQVCLSVINGTLDKIKLELKPLATVVKYAVPEGYPENPIKDKIIDVSAIDKTKVKIFYAAVDQRPDGLYLTGSRAVAITGTAKDIFTAEKIVEEEIKKITGPVFHRADIGTKELVNKRVAMMAELRK
ncbi:MAG: phosphoribosylamine--glycine ligase [Candidatus Komeilibacteria bacterium]|nr:phosphoribosylamine--glycine ligase [Candidatus Komeilibacteria bacterium]